MNLQKRYFLQKCTIAMKVFLMLALRLIIVGLTPGLLNPDFS
jgi:hypothetical protein